MLSGKEPRRLWSLFQFLISGKPFAKSAKDGPSGASGELSFDWRMGHVFSHPKFVDCPHRRRGHRVDRFCCSWLGEREGSHHLKSSAELDQRPKDDLVAYLREIDTMHYRMAKVLGEIGGPGTIEDLERQRENRAAALLVYRRILLRLNTTEDQHVLLAKKLKGLLVLRTRTTDTQQVDDVVSLARQVLKHEWAVT